jgi:hypothetical protein
MMRKTIVATGGAGIRLRAVIAASTASPASRLQNPFNGDLFCMSSPLSDLGTEYGFCCEEGQRQKWAETLRIVRPNSP